MERQNPIHEPRMEPVNPFRFEFDISFLRYLQCVICMCTLLPIRALLVVSHLTVIYILAFIITLGLPRISQTYEMVGWRGKIHWFILNVLWRTMCWSAGVVFYSKGKMVTKEEAPIVVASPHSSILDNLLAPYIQRPFFTVARDETGPIATLLRVICAIYTDRTNKELVEEAHKEIDRRVRDETWPQLLLWPEGTTHNRLGCIRHKLGAYKPGLPVQPLVLKMKSPWVTDIWTFIGPGVLKLWIFTLLQFWVTIEIEYLDVYVPNDDEKANPRLFADNVRRLMAEYLQKPEVDLSRDDGSCLLKAHKLGLPDHVGLVNISYFFKEFGYGRDYIYNSETSVLAQFAELSQGKELADYDDFCYYLRLPRSELMKKLLAIYDRNEMYCFTFRDFLLIRARRSIPATDKLDFDIVFNCCDADRDGKLSFKDVSSTLAKYLGGTEETYRPLWKRFTNEDYISKKELQDIFHTYPEYGLLYELA